MLKKGSLVKFVNGKDTLTGVIVSKGATITKVRTDGYMWTIPANRLSILTEISLSDLQESDTMKEYDITKYKEMEGLDGYVFSCTITKNGKPFLQVFNDGNGGPTDFQKPGGGYDEIRNLEEVAKKFLEEHGYISPFEHLSSWVDWAITARQNGVTAKSYFAKYAEAFAPN